MAHIDKRGFEKKRLEKERGPRRGVSFRKAMFSKFLIPGDTKIDYKNVNFLHKYLNDRGKIIPRRITGISAGDQRLLTVAIKRARFLALLNSGGIKK